MDKDLEESIYFIPQNYTKEIIPFDLHLRVAIETVGGAALVYWLLSNLFVYNDLPTQLFVTLYPTLCILVIGTVIWVSFECSISVFLKDLKNFKNIKKKYSIKKVRRD